MASRLTMVERELLSTKKEVIEKDQKILQLQEKIKMLERMVHQDEMESQTLRDLKTKCLEYQKQIEEMEVCVHTYVHAYTVLVEMKIK